MENSLSKRGGVGNTVAAGGGADFRMLMRKVCCKLNSVSCEVIIKAISYNAAMT